MPLKDEHHDYFLSLVQLSHDELELSARWTLDSHRLQSNSLRTFLARNLWRDLSASLLPTVQLPSQLNRDQVLLYDQPGADHSRMQLVVLHRRQLELRHLRLLLLLCWGELCPTSARTLPQILVLRKAKRNAHVGLHSHVLRRHSWSHFHYQALAQ